MRSPNQIAGALGAAVGLGGAAIVGAYWGLPAALLVLAAEALVLVISAIWASLSHLGGDTPMTVDEALSLAAPTAAEEQKRAVLRALKDLEYELSVGKISRQDYDQATTHYRQQARRLIALADDSLGDRRARAEARAAEYLDERLAAETGANEAETEAEEVAP